MASIVCQDCGHSNAAGTEFCESCAAFLDWAAVGAGSVRKAAPGHERTASGPAPLVPPVPEPRADEGAAQPVAPDDVFDPPLLAPSDRRPRAAPATPQPAAVRRPHTATPPATLKPTTATPDPGTSEAVKPSATVARPAPPRRPHPATAPDEAGMPCPVCQTPNPDSRRFCMRCGNALRREPDRREPDRREPDTGPGLVSTPVGTQRPGSPRRPLSRDPLSRDFRERAARRRYRQALGLRHRLLRAGGVVIAAVVAVAALGVAGLDGRQWLGDRWNQVRPDRHVPVAQVTDVTAASDPADGEEAGFTAANVLDKSVENGWVTTWDGTQGAPPAQTGACAPADQRHAAAALVLTLGQATDLTRVGVGGGLPSGHGQRNSMWRPTVIHALFPDGTCVRLDLEDIPEIQYFPLAVEAVEWVRLDIVAATPPEVDDDSRVAIHAVELSTHR